MARGLENAIEKCLDIHAKYLGLDEGGSIEVNKDFENMNMLPEMLVAYVQAVSNAGLPARVLIQAMQEGGLIGPDVDLDELEAEMMAGQAAIDQQNQDNAALGIPPVPGSKPPPMLPSQTPASPIAPSGAQRQTPTGRTIGIAGDTTPAPHPATDELKGELDALKSLLQELTTKLNAPPASDPKAERLYQEQQAEFNRKAMVEAARIASQQAADERTFRADESAKAQETQVKIAQMQIDAPIEAAAEQARITTEGIAGAVTQAVSTVVGEMAGELVKSQQEGAKQLTKILTGAQDQQTKMMGARIQAMSDMPAPMITVPAPVVNVPEIRVPAPVVHVNVERPKSTKKTVTMKMSNGKTVTGTVEESE